MRVLVMAEGGSDEVLAKGLIIRVAPEAVIVTRTRQLRGIGAVLRSVDTNVRAAHFQHFDLVVMHFDLDDTAVPGRPRESARWREVSGKVEASARALKALAGRPTRPEVILMAPQQSSDCWFAWGIGGDAASWERMDRHRVKGIVFGNPPTTMTEKARDRINSISKRLDDGHPPPHSLAVFLEDLTAAVARIRKRAGSLPFGSGFPQSEAATHC